MNNSDTATHRRRHNKNPSTETAKTVNANKKLMYIVTFETALAACVCLSFSTSKYAANTP